MSNAKDGLDIGVFLCKCGKNIDTRLDLAKLEKALRSDGRVKDVVTLDLACSEAGIADMEKALSKGDLKRVVVAGCSPRVHGHLFQDLVERCGMNRYLCEMANIREQCSWVHSDVGAATEKAIKITKMAIEKVATNEPLKTLEFSINKDILIIGGGITGIQAGLTIAKRGNKAILVERSATLGGNLAAMAKVAPEMECSACILMGKARDLHKLEVMTSSAVLDIKGRYGNFTVTVRKTPRYVDADKCTNCGACAFECMVSVPNEFERGLNERKAIYLPYPHAYPLAHVIDMDNCTKCEDCAFACEEKAIDFDQKEEVLDLRVGAIIVATGSVVDLKGLEDLGLGKVPGVMDSSKFERLLAESGPTFGEPVDFATAEPYEKVAFVHVPGGHGSNFRPMETLLKQVSLYVERVSEGEAIVFYDDPAGLRPGEEQAVESLKGLRGVAIIEGKVSKMEQGKVGPVVKYRPKGKFSLEELEVELVVLSSSVKATGLPDKLMADLDLDKDQYGLIKEPMPNIGITVAGSCTGAESFKESLREGEHAGLIGLGLLVEDSLKVEPMIAVIDKDSCSGCAICVPLCPYRAIRMEDDVAVLDETLCEGCGTCMAACPSGATTIRNMKAVQFRNMIDRAMEV